MHAYLYRPKRGKSASSTIGGARLSSLVRRVRSRTSPRLRFSHSRKREEDDDDDDDDVFPLFFTSRKSLYKSRPFVRSNDATSSTSSRRRLVFFFSRERNDENARRHRTVVDTFKARFKRDALSTRFLLNFEPKEASVSFLEGAHFSQCLSFLSPPRDEKKQGR